MNVASTNVKFLALKKPTDGVRCDLTVLQIGWLPFLACRFPQFTLCFKRNVLIMFVDIM